MHTDLEVPLELLADTSQSLDLLIAEFHSSGRIVDEAHDLVGSRKVIEALGEFSGSWRVHREKLIERMVAVRDMACKGREAFVDADNDLARAIRDSMRHQQTGTSR